MLPTGAIFQLKMHQNAFEAEVRPGPHSPKSASWFKGAILWQGRGWKERWKEGKASGTFPTSFFTV